MRVSVLWDKGNRGQGPKLHLPALTGMAQWVGHHVKNQKVAGSIPGARAWVAGQVPGWGHVRGNDVLSLFFSLPSPLSKSQ